MKLKKLLRYVLIGILILLAMVGIPLGTFLSRREMDEDDQVKTEIVEGSEEKD